MAFTKKKREEMEQVIYQTFDKLDPSGRNTKRYKDFFGQMDDKAFQKFFDHFFNDTSAYLTWETVGYENDLDMQHIKDAAAYLKVPLFEYVMQPGFDDSDEIVSSIQPVPVGYIHMKPVQQMVRKKNSTSVSVDKRDPRTGQVSGEDKDVQFSIDENYGLMAHNAKAVMKEFLSVRADDMVMKQEAYSNIRRDGYMSLADLTDDPENKTALNTLNAYLLAMHIKSDIVDAGYMLRKTVHENERRV